MMADCKSNNQSNETTDYCPSLKCHTIVNAVTSADLKDGILTDSKSDSDIYGMRPTLLPHIFTTQPYTMGINDLLPHLLGGGRHEYCHSFYHLGMKNYAVPFDAASALWQFAAKHAWDYLRGNHTPALIEWAHFLNYLRSICRWDLRVYMDGMENVEKRPEI